MNLTNAGLVSRRYLAGVLVPVISFGALLVSATPAFAELEEATTHDVQVVDESDLVILDSIDVVACYHSDSNQYVCMEPVASEAGVASIDLSSINLPDSTGYVHLSAGGAQNSKYSRSYSSFYVENGLANVTTDLIMNEAEWISVEVTVLEGETPLEGAQISLSGLPVWQSALTDIAGLASFTVDVSSLDPNSVISAELDGNHTGHESRSQDVSTDGSIRTAQIVTNRSSYTLSGVIRDENQDPFSNRKVCFQWGTYPTNKQLELVTDANGGYEIDGVYGYLGLRPSKCFIHWSENLEYDYQSLSHQVLSTGTKDFNMTRTGISLLVTDGTDPIPGISVSLLQGTNTTAYNTKKTDGDGIATFYNLSPGDYTATYMLPTNPYDSARRDLVMFEENTNSVSVTSVPNETVSDYLVLTRLENVTSLHTVRGTVLDLGDNPISNANVRIGVTPIPYRENANFSVDVKTNSIGAFSAVNVPSGRVSVSTYASGYRSSYGVAYETNASVDDYDIGVIRIRPFALSEKEYSGVVRDTRGNPIPNVNLMLWPSWDSGQLMRQETTDSQGRFRFTGLPAGQIYISTFGSNPRYKFKYFNHYLSESVTHEVLVLPDLNPTGASQTAVVSGRLLEYLDVNGPESSVPVANACLSVFPRGGGQGIQAITDSNGIWTVSGLLEGAEYYASYQGMCSEGDSGLPEMFDFQDKYEYLNSWDPLVAATFDSERVDVLLKEISRSGSGSVAGRVKDAETYQNLSGFTVHIYRASGGIQISPVTTDERGEYSFPSLPTGEYYLSVTSSGNDQGIGSHTSSTMSVEVGTTANRANVFLTRNPQAVNEGVVSGTLLDEYAKPHGGGIVLIWDPSNLSVYRESLTDNDGNFTVADLPVGIDLSVRVTPWWGELAHYFTKLLIPESKSLSMGAHVLKMGSSITGQVSGLMTSEELYGYPVYVELLDRDSEKVIERAYTDWLTGRYEFTKVPPGEYLIRFTQNSPPFEPVRSGDGGFYSGTELPSFKPVYWDGTKFGTTDISEAISVEANGITVIGKNVTMSQGSSIVGSLSIGTPDGESKLTGAREVTVTVLQKDPDNNWKELNSYSIAGYTKSTFQIAGLAEGIYKLRFSDIRRGNNALATSFNGGYSTLDEAPEISIGDAKRVVYNHTMTAAPPEKTAEAFDLDDLGSELLDQLKDEISVSVKSDSVAELEIFVGTEFAGEYVSAFANSTPVMLGTWQQVDSRGYISVTSPSTLLAGEHRIAVQDVRGVVFGWTPITIEKPIAAKAKSSPSESQLTSSQMITNESKKSVSKAQGSVDSKPEGAIEQPGQADWYLPLSAAISLFTLAGAIWMVRARFTRRLRS
jgi:hypothetical protein